MNYVLVGRIRKPQGIRGAVTIELLTDTPDAIFAPGGRVLAGTVDGDLAPGPADRAHPRNASAEHSMVIETATPFKGGLIVKFANIPDRTTAERWRHRYLLVPESEVEPPKDDEVFVHELIGMVVRSVEGDTLGTVVGTYDLPQGLMLDVDTPKGSVLVPYRPTLVTEVDRGARVITVDDSTGLFD